MHVYRNTFKVSENFPVQLHETWVVKERNQIVERWTVIHKGKTTFTAQIEQFVAPYVD